MLPSFTLSPNQSLSRVVELDSERAQPLETFSPWGTSAAIVLPPFYPPFLLPRTPFFSRCSFRIVESDLRLIREKSFLVMQRLARRIGQENLIEVVSKPAVVTVI